MILVRVRTLMILPLVLLSETLQMWPLTPWNPRPKDLVSVPTPVVTPTNLGPLRRVMLLIRNAGTLINLCSALPVVVLHPMWVQTFSR